MPQMGKPFGPFDYQRTVCPRLLQAELIKLRWILDTVEIDMPDRQNGVWRIVGEDDRKRRAGNFALVAETLQQTSRQGRLAGAKGPEQGDHVPWKDLGRKGSAERQGSLRIRESDGRH